jgi:lysine decarboxylase
MLLRQAPARWDIPELPGFGGPLQSDGAVAEAQERCAALLGVCRCWFGVNGATGLLQAALLGLCPPGSRPLLPRNVHRSVLHACVLGDLRPLLFTPPFDCRSGLWRPPRPGDVMRLLNHARADGPVAALVVVDPTYQGVRADLGPIVAAAHDSGVPVLVDQAHGDGGALEAGADLVVLSPQKSIGGLAQGAALLQQGERVEISAIERALLWLQTSSPSALLLLSTAAAIGESRSPRGLDRLQRARRRGQHLRRRLEAQGLPLLANADPLRLPLLTGPLGFTGPQADAWLMGRGVVAELPEPGCLTFCLGVAPPRATALLLPRRLRELRQALGGPPLPPFQPPPLPPLAHLEVAIGSAWRAPAEAIPLARAMGRIAAEPLCPYPPGIPLLVPGERLDQQRVGWLLEQRRLWPDQIADTVRVMAG